jgi:hypothetical protein
MISDSTSCPDCGAPMGGDQRYCLNCGQRRGAPRVPFPPTVPTETVTEVAPAAASPRHTSATIWVTAVGVLLLAMGVGVLIGKSGSDDTTQPVRAAAPITVTVPGGTGTAAAAATTTAKSKGKGKSSSKSKKAKASATPDPADTQKIQQLDNLSPSDYAKKSKALPNTVGTTGKAPPKDNKAAGGGSDFEEIG